MLKLRNPMKCLMATAVVCVSALLPAAAQTKPPLKIGGCFSVTGPASYAGAGAMKTVEMYVEAINAAGGIDGRKVEFRGYDDESDASRANTLVKRLIENDKVHVIIGCSLTGPTMSAIPLVERAGIPMVSLGAGSAIVEPVKKFVFKTIHTDAMVVSRLYDHMLGRGIKSIGIIAGSDAFGRSCLSAAQKLAPEKGVKILRDESYNPKDTDMTVQLTKLRQEPGLQAVLNCGFGEPAIIATKNYKQLGITVPHYGTHGLASNDFVRLAGGAAEDMIMANVSLLVWDQLPTSDPQQPVVQAYVKAYRAKFNEAPSFFAGTAHDAFFAIREAVRRSGSIEPAKIRDAIEKGNDFVGVTGHFRMNETDHVGLTPDSLRIVQVKNGRWKLVEKE
jgi:branched-chain amino acid transport system substrate-binding protein